MLSVVEGVPKVRSHRALLRQLLGERLLRIEPATGVTFEGGYPCSRLDNLRAQIRARRLLRIQAGLGVVEGLPKIGSHPPLARHPLLEMLLRLEPAAVVAFEGRYSC